MLELDVGNSSLKWRVLENGCRLQGGRVSSVAELMASLPARITEARVASVAGEERDRELEAALRRAGISAIFARTMAYGGGVRNAYRDVGRMGVDRWLAMLAAFAEARGPCVVMDVGSALTIDLLAADGQHCGGYIIPGVPLLRGVWAKTGRVRFGELAGRSLEPGVNTEECVHHGIWLSVVGAIKHALSLASARWPENYEVYICGGDAGSIIELMGDCAWSWHYRDELVLDGLKVALAADGG